MVFYGCVEEQKNLSHVYVSRTFLTPYNVCVEIHSSYSICTAFRVRGILYTRDLQPSITRPFYPNDNLQRVQN